MQLKCDASFPVNQIKVSVLGAIRADRGDCEKRRRLIGEKRGRRREKEKLEEREKHLEREIRGDCHD